MSDNEIESIVEWWGKPGEPPEGANVPQELEQAVMEAVGKFTVMEGPPNLARHILSVISPLFTRLSQRNEELENSVCQLEAERDASWAWVEQAKGYMQHKDECGFRTRTSRMNVESGELEPSPRPCTCGLDALLSSAPKTDAKAGEHA
jgi:hypothetical protein